MLYTFPAHKSHPLSATDWLRFLSSYQPIQHIHGTNLSARCDVDSYHHWLNRLLTTSEECDSETHFVLIRLWYFLQRIWNSTTKESLLFLFPRQRPTSQRTGHRHRKTPTTFEWYPLQHSYYECLMMSERSFLKIHEATNSRTCKVIIRRHSLGLFNWPRAFTPTSEIQFLHQVLILTLRLLTSYIYGAPILDVSRSHTTTQHSR